MSGKSKTKSFGTPTAPQPAKSLLTGVLVWISRSELGRNDKFPQPRDFCRVCNSDRSSTIRSVAVEKQVGRFWLKSDPYHMGQADPRFSIGDIDHATPLSRGGLHVVENLRISCSTCNNRKSSKTEKEFFAYRRSIAAAMKRIRKYEKLPPAPGDRQIN
jgi:hypothetical protein